MVKVQGAVMKVLAPNVFRFSKSDHKELEELKQAASDIQAIQSIGYVLDWDSCTYMPLSSSEMRGWQKGTLIKILNEKITSDKMRDLLAKNLEPAVFNNLSKVDQALVIELKRQYDRRTKIPEELFQELFNILSLAYPVWTKARETNDFDMFATYLEKVVSVKREMAKYIGYEESPYDALLDEYEPGLKSSTLDLVFGKLKNELTKILDIIDKNKLQCNLGLLNVNIPEEKKLELGKLVLETIGFDFSRGRLDNAHAPFSLGIAPNDVRLTIDNTNDLYTIVLIALHEGGHGLYDLGFDPELARLPLYDGPSLSLHESQSRLYETIIGYNLPFWRGFLPKLKTFAPEKFEAVSAEEIYKALNYLSRKEERTQQEYDEITYHFHYMIRYEIEKMLIEGKLNVKDIPTVWNEKFFDYLGIPPDEKYIGALVFDHWVTGDFGYFPSYVLGTLYAAQFYKKAKSDIPDLEMQISRGNFKPLNDWLRENIHKCAKTETQENLIKRVTGEPLNPDHFLSYIKEKYGELYGVKL